MRPGCWTHPDMTPLANRSIAPDFPPAASHQTGDPDPQRTLGLGPGRVHRGPEPRTEAELQDNREYLRVAGQVDFGPRAHVLFLVWMAVAYYASLAPERTCFARVDTLAKKAKGLSPRTVQRKLHELAVLGYISTDQRSGGFHSTHWDVVLDPDPVARAREDSRGLTVTACHPPPDSVSPQPRQRVMENHDSVSPDLRDRRLGIEEKQAAREAPSPPATGPAAAAPLNDHPSQQPDEQPDTTARHTCPTCGNTWPARFGTTCYQCPQPTAAQLRRREQQERNRASEQDPSLDEAPPRPDPPPLTPERRKELEDRAIRDGYHKREDGSWTHDRGEGVDAPPPPDGGEPGPNQRRLKAQVALWKSSPRPTAARALATLPDEPPEPT